MEYYSFERNELEFYIIYLFYIIEPNIILDFRYRMVASPHHPPPKEVPSSMGLALCGGAISHSFSQSIKRLKVG